MWFFFTLVRSRFLFLAQPSLTTVPRLLPRSFARSGNRAAQTAFRKPSYRRIVLSWEVSLPLHGYRDPLPFPFSHPPPNGWMRSFSLHMSAERGCLPRKNFTPLFMNQDIVRQTPPCCQAPISPSLFPHQIKSPPCFPSVRM